MANTVDIQVDVRQALGFFDGLNRQMPYAIALGINRTADDAQAAIRKNVTSAFILRRSTFVLNTIKIANTERATKQRLEAVLRVDPNRDQLAKFEMGGPKLPRSAKNLAVPITARPTPQALIPSRLQIRNLDILPANTSATGVGFRKSRKTGQITTTHGRQRHAGQGLQRTFITSKGIMQRVGKGKTSGVRVLYAFEKSVPIAPDLHFVPTAQATVGVRWTPNMIGALDVAMRTAR